MHRQSLGSPASKLQFNGIIFSGIGDMKNNTDNNSISENHRKDKSTSSSSIAGATDEQHKSQKSSQQNSTPASNSSKLVHLIPILTFFCFLILYLSSHDPSPKGKFHYISIEKFIRFFWRFRLIDNLYLAQVCKFTTDSQLIN